MQVPYANQWQKEMDKLRKIAMNCDLTEEIKWGKPCFTFLKKNIVIIIPLKESCALSFFKGALLKDSKRILKRIGEHTQAGRWIKFTSVKEITALQSALRSYLYEAIELEESGKKVKFKSRACSEPPILQFFFSPDAGVQMRASTHQPWANRQNMHSLRLQFRMQTA